MKNLLKKFCSVYLVSLLFIVSAFAAIDLQGDSDNLAPINSPAFAKCNLSLESGGLPVGNVVSTRLSDQFSEHIITTVLGNLKLVINNNTAAIRQENLVDPTTGMPTDFAAGFPDTSLHFLPNDRDPSHYQIWTAEGNIYKAKALQTPGSTWTGTGLFKNINFLQIRCVYLVRISNDYPAGFRVIRCLGCNYILDIR